MAIEGSMMIALFDDGEGPALEAPAHLGTLGRIAYYNSHRRFMDFFVPLFTVGLGHGCFLWLTGEERDPIHLGVGWLFFNSTSWLGCLAATGFEAVRYRDQPRDEIEEYLWTEGMTRREFLERKRR
ncbi:hypothetical protein F5Y08DRAFT_303892 [Xylaria arbuscula]|nr:hypothetical protein F5Y08DRAFT_303892 [Xylaria arbuscula]